jgi:hypothetical protein
MSRYDEFRVEIREDYPEPGWWDVRLEDSPISGLIGAKDATRPILTRQHLSRLRSRHGWPNLDALKEIGSAVWRSFMTAELEAAFFSCLEHSTNNGKGLHIIVTTVNAEHRAPGRVKQDDPIRLAELPIEAIYHERLSFLATNLNTPICRSLQRAPDLPTKQIKLPLRVLVVIATPTDKPNAQAKEEAEAIQHTLRSLKGQVTMALEETPTRHRLSARLKEFDVFHFIGHGGFDPVGSDPTSQAYICLLREDNHASDWFTAHDLANMLQNTPVRLAVFTACSSAAPTPDEPPDETLYPIGAFSGIAQRLLSDSSGIAAAVAMQFDMEADAAVAFSQTFYRQLLNPDTTLAESVTLARQQVSFLKGIAHRAWITPAAYCRAKQWKVFDIVGQQEKLSEAMNFTGVQKTRLRDSLLKCKYMKYPESRRQIVSDLQRDFKGLSFRSYPDPQLEVADILDSCLDYGGTECLQAFLTVLESYEGAEANTMKEVWNVWKEMMG